MSAAYAKLGGQARLAAVADVAPEAAEKLAGKFDIPLTFERYEELLARPEVDAVLICTPTFLHEEIAIAAAKARKHIFCQKPMALTVEACQAIDRAARGAGVVLQAGFMVRFTPPFTDVKEAIVSGEIGDLIALRSSVFGWEPSAEWFYDPLKGGGVLIDTIIHTLDLFRWYAGEVEVLFASGGAYVLEGAKKYGTPTTSCAACVFATARWATSLAVGRQALETRRWKYTGPRDRSLSISSESKADIFILRSVPPAESDPKVGIILDCFGNTDTRAKRNIF